MPPLIIGGALVAGGSIISAGIASGAAGSAEEAGLQGQRESIAFQKEQAAKAEALYRQYADQARADLAPVREAQAGALTKLGAFTDPNNPYYQMERQQGTEAIQRQLAAQGLLRSKKQVDLLSGLESNLTGQRLGIMQGLAGLGGIQGTAELSSNLGSGLAGMYGNLGTQVGSSFQKMGDISGQASLASGGAWANMASGLGGTLGGIFTGLAQEKQMQPFYDLIAAYTKKLSK